MEIVGDNFVGYSVVDIVSTLDFSLVKDNPRALGRLGAGALRPRSARILKKWKFRAVCSRFAFLRRGFFFILW